MNSLTVLQEFKVKAYSVAEVQTYFQSVLGAHGLNECKAASNIFDTSAVATPGLFCLQFLRQDGCHAIVRGQPPDLVTMDLHLYSKQDKQTFNKFAADLHDEIAKMIGSSRQQSLPAIQRGAEVPVYFPTAGGQLVEYDFEELLFETDTPYQNVKVLRSPQFGSMLILDNDPNMAESDLSYTHAITGHGREDYRDKTVLILGGGDGGILHELRKEKPRHITMLEIDEVVIEQARKHMRGCCFDSLDELTGQGYEVLITDCIPVLRQYIAEGKTFDFVINDLTAIPCTRDPVGDLWDFLRWILDLSMQVLAPHGKYYTQGNGKNMTQALRLYEEQLQKLRPPVDFRTSTVCVPSYHELWVFYEIWKKSEKDS